MFNECSSVTTSISTWLNNMMYHPCVYLYYSALVPRATIAYHSVSHPLMAAHSTLGRAPRFTRKRVVSYNNIVVPMGYILLECDGRLCYFPLYITDQWEFIQHSSASKPGRAWAVYLYSAVVMSPKTDSAVIMSSKTDSAVIMSSKTDSAVVMSPKTNRAWVVYLYSAVIM